MRPWDRNPLEPEPMPLDRGAMAIFGTLGFVLVGGLVVWLCGALVRLSTWWFDLVNAWVLGVVS